MCDHNDMSGATRRKQERPGNAPNDNTAHMPTARSSADLIHTPTRHTLTKAKIILQMATPQAASSQRTHISRTLGCTQGRMHPVNRRMTSQYLHAQSVTTQLHEAPTSRRQDELASRCNTTTKRSRPKRCATVPPGEIDPMGARVMYSVKAPAGEEYRMCLNKLEAAKTCDKRERALIKKRA